MPVNFGVKFGQFNGALFGNSFSVGGPVTADGTSGKLVPANSTEWSNFLANNSIALGVPQHLYSFQEASGNALDGIGSTNLTATAITYSKPVTGWSRVAMSGTGSANSNLTNATYLDTAANSFLVFMYLRYDAVTVATRGLVTFGSPLLQIPDNKIRLREGAALASTVNDHSTTVHPIVMAFNNLNTTIKMYSDLEKLTIAYSASSGSGLTLIPSALADPGVSDLIYMTSWGGASAETTDAEIKKLITGLGYSPPWS